MNRKKPKSRNGGKWVSHEVKMEIIRDYHLEGINQPCLAEKYGISQSCISSILCKFAADNNKSALFMKKDTTDTLSEEIKALRKEVLDHKKKLYEETMRADFYDTMIDVAEEMFDIEIRKKADTGQSKGCIEKGSNIQ